MLLTYGAIATALLATFVACGGHAPPPQPDPSNTAAQGDATETPSPVSSAEGPLDGLQVGEYREDHYGVLQDWKPVYLDRRVSLTPDGKWDTLAAAKKQLGDIAMSSTSGQPSAVAILAIGDHFVAHFLTKQPGSQSDIRRRHIRTEFRASDARWVDTIDGPEMNPQPNDATQPSATP